MAYTAPTVAEFKTYFVRDFPYGATTAAVMDADITSAISDAVGMINEDLFSDQASYTTAYMQLAAHFLVMNLRASGQGIAGNYPWMQASKSVGQVSESFQIPQRILDNPQLAMLSKTYYGAKYLFLIMAQLTGAVYTVEGATNP